MGEITIDPEEIGIKITKPSDEKTDGKEPQNGERQRIQPLI